MSRSQQFLYRKKAFQREVTKFSSSFAKNVELYAYTFIHLYRNIPEKVVTSVTVLQIRMGTKDNLGIIFHISA